MRLSKLAAGMLLALTMGSGASAAQVGVLVVHAGDLPVNGCCGDAALAVGSVAGGDGHVQVVRDVAFAHRQDGQAGLGAGLNRRPDLHRRMQAVAAAHALRNRTHVTLVGTMVMGNVATGA